MKNYLTNRRPSTGRFFYFWLQATAILGIFLSLSACQLLKPKPTCDFQSVKFIADFPGARLNACDKQFDNHFLLSITPENLPINDSPWYAFKIISDTPQTISITVKFIDGLPRYRPKQSRDQKNWQLIRYQKNESTINFDLKIEPGSTWVAGQELLLPSDYENWLENKTKAQNNNIVILGKSVQGHDITALDISSNNKDTIVILGRQHPPEVTGALALFPFVDRLLLDDEIARDFRERFRIIVIPLVNPDGVIAGNWRHNANGIDTNRDWGIFSQAETRQIANYLKLLHEAGQQFYLGLDFHSTGRNYFYTQQDEDLLCPQQFTADWLKNISEAIPDFNFRRSARSSDGNPTFKQWFNETYQVPSISYEMSDQIDRDQLVEVAEIAAESMMEELLQSQCPL